MLQGRATAVGTSRYAARFPPTEAAGASGPALSQPVPCPQHFRSAIGLAVSSIGSGTYLGELSDQVDERYTRALVEAVRCGCNLLDTAVSYRAQRSELALGRAIAELVQVAGFGRDELIVCSKGGFIAYRLERPADPLQYVYTQLISAGVAQPDDLAGGIHCMAPDYLSQQITWSLRNLGLRTLDVYHIHNPETQLSFVDRATFRNRIQLAFARLEEEVVSGRIGCYGISTWEGLRAPPMSAGYMNLELLTQLATEVGGTNHHFKVVQFPLNVAQNGAATLRNQPIKGKLQPLLTACYELGLAVVASASIAQAQLAGRLSTSLREQFPDLKNDIERALQFTRSLPGVTAALVGMSRTEHVHDNLALSAYAPDPERALRLAQSLAR